jgi:hypothetical protein
MSEDVKTVRVRIAVGVTAKGTWSAVGWGGPGNQRNDEELAGIAREGLADGTNEAVHFVEVDVPLPMSQVLEGELK